MSLCSLFTVVTLNYISEVNINKTVRKDNSYFVIKQCISKESESQQVNKSETDILNLDDNRLYVKITRENFNELYLKLLHKKRKLKIRYLFFKRKEFKKLDQMKYHES